VLDPVECQPPYSSPLNHPMSFVKLSIFGTSFEVGFLSSPFLHLSHQISGHHKICRSPTRWHGSVFHSIPPLNPAHPLQGAFGLVWYVDEPSFPPHITNVPSSSAKDQLTGASVAIKKIMKPFSTPVLSKRTYRELKLLKHIQHENVRLLDFCLIISPLPIPSLARSSALATFSSHLWRICGSP
jgi:hypothetical protein